MQTRQQLPSIDVIGAADAPDAVLLDVREPAEWDAGHIAGALHLPMSQLTERVDEVPAGRRVVCVCRSGNRSGQVTAWLLAQGVDAVNMDGGMLQWAAAGQPVVATSGGPGRVI